MEHVVFSAAVDGVGEEFRRVSNLEEAVRVVEHLRNDLGIEDASVFALTPVPLAFRTYYRVEVSGEPAASAQTSSAAELVTEPSAAESLFVPESLLVDEPDLEPLPSVVPLLEPDTSRGALESMAQIAEAVDAAEVGESSEPADAEVHQLSELPAMLAPGLEPREGDEASEHSLGYFTR